MFLFNERTTTYCIKVVLLFVLVNVMVLVGFVRQGGSLVVHLVTAAVYYAKCDSVSPKTYRSGVIGI